MILCHVFSINIHELSLFLLFEKTSRSVVSNDVNVSITSIVSNIISTVNDILFISLLSKSESNIGFIHISMRLRESE